MRTKKYLLILLASAAVFTLNSCLESDELINAKAGGMITAPEVVPFKNVDITLNYTIHQGAAVEKVLLYKQYTHNADTTSTDSVLLATIDVNGANADTPVEKSITLSWADLKENMPTLPKGYIIPDDGMDAVIGDFFTIYFKSVLSDGSVHQGAKTIISIANFFAGDYDTHIIYRHPSFGDYPDNILVDEDDSKTLLAVDGKTCVTSFAVWGPAEKMYITIDPDNDYAISIVVENWDYDVALGDPNRPDLISNYDPATGVLTLYYHYYGSNGPRIFWETFTPK